MIGYDCPVVRELLKRMSREVILILGVMAAGARQLTLIRLRDFELQQFA
jgi:hypothetical protein